ncbi:hypothetical protein FJ251_16300, partial [bacterium]|nr:hypothetical protein [bacterium]
MVIWRALGPLVAVIAALNGSALGSTHLVPEEFATIQAAIDACAPGDSVSIARGTYTGSANVSLSIPPIGLVIVSREGREVTILDGERLRGGPVLIGMSEPRVVVKGLTIKRCTLGLWLEDTNPILSDLIFLENWPMYYGGCGGGIYCNDSSPTLTDVLFEANASPAGGGMCCGGFGRPEFARVQFVGNWAEGYGAGLSCFGEVIPTFSEVAFLDNLSGLYLAVAGHVELEGLEFMGNRLAVLARTDGPLIVPSVTIRDCLFDGNGRAVDFQAPGALSIESCNFAFGEDGWGAAAIAMRGGGQLTLTRSIVAFNENQFGVSWDGSGPAPVIECSDVFGG